MVQENYVIFRGRKEKVCIKDFIAESCSVWLPPYVIKSLELSRYTCNMGYGSSKVHFFAHFLKMMHYRGKFYLKCSSLIQSHILRTKIVMQLVILGISVSILEEWSGKFFSYAMVKDQQSVYDYRQEWCKNVFIRAKKKTTSCGYVTICMGMKFQGSGDKICYKIRI